MGSDDEGSVEIKSEKVDSTLTLEKSASPFLPHCLSPGWGSQLPNSVQEVFPIPLSSVGWGRP